MLNEKGDNFVKLIHQEQQNVWQFIQGESVIPLDGHRTFESREQAVGTARQLGLAIDKTGSVVVAGRSRKKITDKKTRTQTTETDSNKRRRITLWLDANSLTVLDQLTQKHGSRSDSICWLLNNTAREPL